MVDQDRIITGGGRVLGITAWADDLAQARDRAYDAVSQVRWPGAFNRRDIGAKGLIQEAS